MKLTEFKKTIKLFLPYFTKAGLKPLLVTLLVLLINALIIASIPYFSKTLISYVYEPSQKLSVLLGLMILSVLMIVLDKILSHILAIVFFPVMNKAIQGITYRVVARVHNMPLKEFEYLSSGALLSAIKRISQSCRTFLKVTFVQCAPAILKTCAILITVGLYKWYLACALSLLSLSLVLALRQLNTVMQLRCKAWSATDQVSVAISNSLLHFNTSRAHLKFESQQLAGVLNEEARIWQKYNFQFEWSQILIELILALSLIITLSVTLFEFQAKNISAGEFVFLQTTFFTLIREFKSLLSYYRQIREVQVDMKNIIELMESNDSEIHLPQLLNVKASMALRYLKLENLSYCLENVWVFRNINLKFKPGQIVAIIGKSGVGKSTLLKCIAGLETATTGKITINHKVKSYYGAQNWNARIHYIAQNTLLFNHTLYYNLCYGLDYKPSEQRLFEVIKSMRLEIMFQALAQGLNTSLGEFGAKLSGGEQQRVLLARALLAKPEILLLDETTASLEEGLEKDLILELQKEIPIIIIVSHRLSILKCSHEAFLLAEGALQPVSQKILDLETQDP